MKTIEQLLQLRKNPYYKFSVQEQKLLDDFLSKNSEQNKQPRINSKNSEKSTPATVHTKNIVHTDNGVVPTDEQVAEAQNLADQPPYHKTEAA